jgi:hypothetical protein
MPLKETELATEQQRRTDQQRRRKQRNRIANRAKPCRGRIRAGRLDLFVFAMMVRHRRCRRIEVRTGNDRYRAAIERGHEPRRAQQPQSEDERQKRSHGGLP